jgi:phage shock protein A
VFLLGLLLALAIAGAGFLGYHAFQLRINIAELDAQFVEEKRRYQGLVTKHNEGVKKWNEHSAAMKAEIHRLSPWKHIADADAKAAEMIRAARANVERANGEATSMVVAAQERANALLGDAEQKAAAAVAMRRMRQVP